MTPFQTNASFPLFGTGTLWPKGEWPDGTLCVLVGIIGFLVGFVLGRVVFG